MSIVLPFLSLLAAGLIAAYLRTSLRVWAAISIAGLAIAVLLHASLIATTIATLLYAVVALPLLHAPTRRHKLSAPLLKIYTKMLPQLSDTEKTALEAGTVGWEGELFSGMPHWKTLLSQPKPELSAEELAFINGPAEQVCQMNNDWEVCHERADLAPEVWEFLKKHKFFGMIIPRDYGGLGFSALAHSRVLQKLNSASPTLGSTVAVPNSLGPAELILHYGTDEQKQHYLPRLADGREIPCFALTGPNAGSDATSLPDYGIVCEGNWEGANVVGVRLNFDKRYITLAPVASVIGLAFRMHDPDGLLSDVKDRGITLALLPRATPGLEVGRRHFPLNIPFQNGPVRGKDVFVPLHYLIGGEAMIGQGWRMLVECLSVGRAISLPSGGTAGVKLAALTTGAYARIRKQFGLPIGRFEGVEEALARIAGRTYAISALSEATAAAVDRGEKPSVPSAIAKYHATETMREVIKDAMDVHGGKGIVLGPRNYLGRAWQGAPISITVEGANILTRSMMIFGQGAIRCHPWVLKEMQAAQHPDESTRLKEFDRTLFGHIGFAVSNAVRSAVLGLTAARIGSVPGDAYTRRFYRRLNRYSANLALVADTSMLTLGGKLKFKESLSARLGDVLSLLYIASSVLKRYEDRDRPAGEQPLLAWALFDINHRIELALSAALRNFPIRPVGWLLWLLVFPWGRRAQAPSDRLGHRAASLLLTPSDTRDRLSEGVFTTPCANNPAGRVNAALPKVIAAEPVERKLLKAIKAGEISALDPEAQLQEARLKGLLSNEEATMLHEVRLLVDDIIAVDDFDSADLESATMTRRRNAQINHAA
ncbi:MAG: Acyl-coenzyme A dehydrogenase [Alphaproteobacteria bacterium ADurb.BinA280]|jgi:acyl-CoA dehydrogenase|nr:acyl-CoA dehydrogenase [Xanthomonadales bacterium]MCC6503940.1 acyl-CoA dehydrogenase [Aquimonas sp.]OPZ13053.1 MAG: Acyl-coenzyme A dehydrogenase [Alphaproteobacteria bacterium ADurb.BinA280]